MASFFSALVAFVKAIPIIDGYFQQLITLYVNTRIDSMSAENRVAIKKAINEQDQRDLEKAMGNPNAGEPSNVPGSVIRDTLPGVHN